MRLAEWWLFFIIKRVKMLTSKLDSSDHTTFDQSPSVKCWCRRAHSKRFFICFLKAMVSSWLCTLLTQHLPVFYMPFEHLSVQCLLTVAASSEDVCLWHLTVSRIGFLSWCFVITRFLLLLVLFLWDQVSMNLLIADSTAYWEHFDLSLLEICLVHARPELSLCFQ